MHLTPRACLLASAALLVAAPAWAQPSTPPSPTEDREVVGRDPTRDTEDGAVVVSEIVVRGQALREDNAYSTTTLNSDFIRERRITDVEELFRDVPGMNLRDYGLSGVASQIVIRGFASGGHGGDLGIVVDGIPLNESNSHADGYVDVNVLVPLEIGALTVYRGPVSALYGNFNRGGLIAYETRKGGDYAEADISVGGFETVDVQGALGTSVGLSGQFNGAVQAFTSNGFRPRSDVERYTASARYSQAVGERLDIAISARVLTLDAQTPAYSPVELFNRDPYGIDPRVMRDIADKDFGTLRADVGYTLTDDLRLLGFVYGTSQEFTRYFSRPINATTYRQREETYQRRVGGGGFSLNGRAQLSGWGITYVAGVDAFSENTDFQFYEGLIFRRRTAPAVNNRELELNSVSAYAEANIDLTRTLQLSLSARYDTFSGECRRAGAETTTEPCDALADLDSFDPKIGVRFQPLPWLQLRASYSQGFALPSAAIKFAPGAEGLEPNAIEQIEVGVRLTPTDQVEVDLVGYFIDSTSEIRTVAPGEFENFGATERTGLEATLIYRPLDTLELRAVYGYADSEIVENANATLLGRVVAGVPDHTATLYGAWRPMEPLRLTATYRYTGQYFLDATNTVEAESVQTLDVGASYEVSGFATPVRVYVNAENVTDEVYASSRFIIGGQQLVAAGSPRFVRAGLQIGF